ncbi:MAG: chemotaxis protein CheB, partial [Mycobacterium sp.]
MPDERGGVRTIVVGSSAGGLDALTRLLGAVRPGLGWCLVIAQHLSPNDPSALVSLLGRVSALPVVEATDGAGLEPDLVLVTPPGIDIVVNSTTLNLVEPDEGRRPWPSIDRLFVSAAAAFADDAVAVVLSGTGEDGAGGAESIMAAGGVVVIQDQASAAFGSMPGAAYATGSTDLQLPPQNIPAALESMLATRPADAPGDGVLDDAAVESTIVALHSVTGIDYSGYKRSTLRRQIERRLRLANLTPAEYLSRLADDAHEAATLSRSMLIGVTAFFRDAPVWDAASELLRELISGLPPMTQLRIWVPGCASGEEAYTVAMLAAEALGPHHAGLSGRLKVFATDLDERSLAATRRARYSEETVAAVPSRLRDRWMRRVDQEWDVVAALRECMVVAPHNVAFDPPFPRLHLISLRNTMIYFQPHLQDRVLRLCHFALVPDGLLVLGKSEQVPRLEALFAAAASEHRIYRRRDSAEPVLLPAGRYLPSVPLPHTAAPATRLQHGLAMYRRLLRTLAEPALVLDADDALIEVIGDVSSWCVVGEGRHSGHATELLRDPYQLIVRTMLSQSRQHAGTSVVRQIDAAPDAPVEVTVTQVLADGIGAVVTFRAIATTPTAAAPVLIDAAGSPMTAALESAHDALRVTIADLSDSNEQLQALNEELQASAEELQATTEEAQATNEELESANEE